MIHLASLLHRNREFIAKASLLTCKSFAKSGELSDNTIDDIMDTVSLNDREIDNVRYNWLGDSDGIRFWRLHGHGWKIGSIMAAF